MVLLLESGGVRLQEANAGLIAVSEVIRAILGVRAFGIPVAVAIGGAYGCFGGMGIAASCATSIVMSEESRLGLSGPEVIETAQGVEEFDSRDRALVWRTTGGKHRFLTGDCGALVEDSLAAFRASIVRALRVGEGFDLARLERDHALLGDRLRRFGDAADAADIWRASGFGDAAEVSLLTAAELTTRTAANAARTANVATAVTSASAANEANEANEANAAIVAPVVRPRSGTEG